MLLFPQLGGWQGLNFFALLSLSALCHILMQILCVTPLLIIFLGEGALVKANFPFFDGKTHCALNHGTYSICHTKRPRERTTLELHT